MRKPIIAGNWKMNMTPSETAKLIGELKPLIANEACDVVVCPPACCLAAAKDALCGSEIRLGAQNVHWEKSGAYTGEVSAAMLKELGVVLLLHIHPDIPFLQSDSLFSFLPLLVKAFFCILQVLLHDRSLLLFQDNIHQYML